MTSTLAFILELFLVFFAGMFLARVLGPLRFRRTTSCILNLSLYALLFLMGVNTASIPGIFQKLGSMGLHALFLTLGAVAGSFLLGFLYDLLLTFRHPATGAPQEQTAGSRFSFALFRQPVLMVSFVAIGMVSAPLFRGADISLPIDILLFTMMGMVGMQMTQSRLSIRPLLRSPDLLVLPLLTIAGTWLGTVLVSLFLPYTTSECLAMVSGFGWYSFSGAIITSAGFPILGTISFLSNLMREMFCFFLIPVVAKLFPEHLNPAINICGTSSLDFLLPILRQNFGLGAVIKAILHGCFMVIFVPLLIPLWMAV